MQAGKLGPAWDSDAESGPERARHAEHETAEGDQEKGHIRYIHATSENITPFGPADFGVNQDESPEPPEAPAASGQKAGPDEQARTPASAVRTQTTLAMPSPPKTPNVEAAGPQTPTVTLRWVKQSDINVGQECQCHLYAANNGETTVMDVTVLAYFPKSVRLTWADPEPTEARDRIRWDFDSLKPGEEKLMRVRMIPSRRGELKTTAFVRFTGAASGLFQVQEPLLAVDVKGPQKVLIGDPASQTIMVSNPGTGVATNVKLEAQVPKGLEHLRGERLMMDIGSLNPGETRIVRIALAAVGPGQQELNLRVTADGEVKQAVAETIEVVSASLGASVEGPEVRNVGRDGRYVLTIVNDGEAASNNVRAVYRVPEGFEFVRAEKGGRHDGVRRTVSWFVGRLEPGQKTQLAVDLTATRTGSFAHKAEVSSEHGVRSDAEFTTLVKGTASLALEIVERDDPVEVGKEAAYEIRASNDGSEPALNVGLSFELPAGVKHLKSVGPSDHLAENGLVLFKSFDRLDPGKTAVYRIYVRGTSAGNHRFRARLVSDSIVEPIVSEETTKFYGE